LTKTPVGLCFLTFFLAYDIVLPHTQIMLTIRLQRLGKKKHPTYRFIVSEKAKDTQSGALEILGNYDPVAKPKVIALKKDRIEYWISKGAQTSNTVHNLLLKEGIVKGEKKRSVFLSAKRKANIEETKNKETPAEAPAAPSASPADV